MDSNIVQKDVRLSRKGYVWQLEKVTNVDEDRSSTNKISDSSLPSPKWKRICLELVVVDGISYLYGWEDDTIIFSGRVGDDAFGLKEKIGIDAWDIVVWSINSNDLCSDHIPNISNDEIRTRKSESGKQISSTSSRRLSGKYYSADDVFSKFQNKVVSCFPGGGRNQGLAPLGNYQFQVETAATGILQLACRTRYELGMWIDALRIAAQHPVEIDQRQGYWSIWCVLASSFARAQLKNFLIEQLASEVIDFWQAVETLRRIVASGSGARKRIAKQIFAEFVADGAPRQVTLSAEIRAQTQRQLEAFVQTRNLKDDSVSEDSQIRQQRKVRYLLGESEAQIAQKETKVTRLLGGREAALALNAGTLHGRLARANSAPCVLKSDTQLILENYTAPPAVAVSKKKQNNCALPGQEKCPTCFDTALKQVIIALEQDALSRFATTTCGKFVHQVLRAEHSDGALKIGALRFISKGHSKLIASLLAPRSLVWWSKKPNSSPKFSNLHKKNSSWLSFPPDNEIHMISVIGVETIIDSKSSTGGFSFALRLNDTSGARLIFSAPNAADRDAWVDLIRQAAQANQQQHFHDEIVPDRDWQLDRLDDSPKKQTEDTTWSELGDIETVESDDDDDDESISCLPIMDSSVQDPNLVRCNSFYLSKF